MGLIKRQHIYVIILVVIFLNRPITIHSEQVKVKDTYNVLYINSYNMNFPNTEPIINGIKAEFNNYDIILDIEYMDSKRYFSNEHVNNFHKIIKYKIDKLGKYDGIIVSDDNALQFILDYYDLFIDMPVVFLGINDLDRANLAINESNIMGVIENLSIKENIALGLKISPRADKVYAIVDDSYTGIGDKKQFYSVSEEFPDLEFNHINFSEHNDKSIEETLKDINIDASIIIYLSMNNDKNGNYLSINEASKLLTKYIDGPILRSEVEGIGDGILGGNMVDYYQQGNIAAKMLMERIITPTNISWSKYGTLYNEPSNNYIFDYNIVKKYNINTSIFPEGSTFINKELNFYEENKDIILYFVSIITLVILVISYLTYLNLKNTRIIKALQRQEEIILKMANYDTLTGLPNRHYFFSEMRECINNNKTGTVLLLDLDDFKKINDTRGHIYGNKLLKEIANILQSINFSNDILIGRYGGDEFLILIKDVYYNDITVPIDSNYILNYNGSDNQKIFDYLKKLIRMFSTPLLIDGYENYVFFSMGITCFPKDSKNVETLIMNADTAMYKVKNSGKNNFAFFNNDMHDEIKLNLEIENTVRTALKTNKLKLLYQPIINTETKQVSSFEALLRIKDNSISPGVFIPIIEKSSLIIEIGRWVTQEAVKQLSIWQKQGYKVKPVSINFSNSQINDLGYYNYLKNILERYNVSPKLIEIEITETVFLKQTEDVLEYIDKLRNLGVKIVLDDFGTKYSSLKYLTSIPVDKVKIDKYFCDTYLSNEESNIISSLINLIHSFGMKVVAEGVEKEFQYEKLKESNCNYIQGFLFYKPLENESINEILSTNKSITTNSLNNICNKMGITPNEIMTYTKDIEEIEE